MPLDAAVRARLKPMLMLLSSDIEGERAAAAAAVTRTLKQAGADRHDLADLLTADAPPLASPMPATAPEMTLRPRPDGGYEITASDLMMIVQRIREDVYFDTWTDGFLSTLEDRSVRFGTVFVSEKQAAVLVKLIERIPA